MSETNSIVTFSKPVVAAYVNLLAPKAFSRKVNGILKESGEPKFGCTLVIPPDHPDLQTVKDTAIAVCKAKWPGLDVAAAYKAGNLKMPWKSGDKEHARYVANKAKLGEEDDGKMDFVKGNVLIKASSKFRPRLGVIKNGVLSDDLDEQAVQRNKEAFYSGVEVYAEINLNAYDAIKDGDQDGVNSYLNLVLSTGKGKRLGGGRSIKEAFAQYVGKASDLDPTAGDPDGLDDEIPF